MRSFTVHQAASKEKDCQDICRHSSIASSYLETTSALALWPDRARHHATSTEHQSWTAQCGCAVHPRTLPSCTHKGSGRPPLNNRYGCDRRACRHALDVFIQMLQRKRMSTRVLHASSPQSATMDSNLECNQTIQSAYYWPALRLVTPLV